MLFDYADALQERADIDDEVKAHFTSYLCVRTSGYVEFAVKTILREYAKSKTNEPNISNFVNSQMERTLNPNRGAMLSLIGEFNSDWSETIKADIKNEIGTSLDSIVSLRNQIAHGEDVTLAFHDMQKYFGHAQEVVKLIYKQCTSAEAANGNQ